MEGDVFLIQTSAAESDHDSEADTWAEEPLEYNFYRNNQWHKKIRDSDFEEIEEGDIVLLYCTGNVDQCPKQIKYIYEVDEKLERRGEGNIGVDNQINLSIKRELTRGFGLHLIRIYVNEGRLSEPMNEVGTIGFNVTQVEEQDLETILEWDEDKGPEIRGLDILEENLRENIVEEYGIRGVDKEYEGFEIYEDDDGNSGELYNTPIGEIDILYENSEKNKFLVVELKRTEDTSDVVVGQIARYIGWVKEEISEGEEVEGLIITQTASEQLKHAVEALDNSTLKEFSLKFDFHDPD